MSDEVLNIRKNIEQYRNELIETLNRLDEEYNKLLEYESLYTKFSRAYWETRLMYLKERREIIEKLAKIDFELHKQTNKEDTIDAKDIVDALKS